MITMVGFLSDKGKIIQLWLIVENGSDMVVSIVYHLLQEFLQDQDGKLPRKLHLNLGKSRKSILIGYNLGSALIEYKITPCNSHV